MKSSESEYIGLEAAQLIPLRHLGKHYHSYEIVFEGEILRLLANHC